MELNRMLLTFLQSFIKTAWKLLEAGNNGERETNAQKQMMGCPYEGKLEKRY
jgi:hypothetical protein